MKPPKDPRAMLGMSLFLKKKRLVLQYRDGTNLFAPIGMETRIVSVHGKYPRGIFPVACSFPQGRQGYELKWSELSEKQPKCSKCGHETDPKDLIAIPPFVQEL